MTIDVELSKHGILRVIAKLEAVKDNLTADVQHVVEILANEGASQAQSAYGRMAKVTTDSISESESRIVVSGGDSAIIAEFGAGYATMEYHPFAANAPVPIKVASYSKAQRPYGSFYISDDLDPGRGYWFFGGVEYDRVQPRHGLLNAYDYIMEHGAEVVEEVIKL